MLHVKIDIVPFGQEDGRRQIAEIFIANIGAVKTQPGWAHYHIYLQDPRSTYPGQMPDAVTKHERSKGAELLVRQSIAALETVGLLPRKEPLS